RSDARFLNQDNTGVLIWRINKISYPDGNYIQFYWTSDDRDNRIYEIKYTGNSITGQAPYNLIKFHYKSARLDPNTVYEAGSNMTSRYLLDRVEVKAESATVKNYYLRYGFDGYRSLLNSIQEKGSDGTALNSTIFRYGSQPNDFSTQSLSAFAGEAVDLFSGDFDGDGYTDILTAPYAYEDGIKFNTALKVYRRTSTDPNYSLTYNYTLPASSTVVNGMNIPKFHNLISSDFDGDGRDDIMTLSVRISGSQNWRKLTNLTLHRSTGTSFSRSNYSGPAGFDIIHPSLKYYYPGDFNGDGMTDYILFLSNGTGYRAFISFGGTTYRNIEVPGLGTGSYPGTSWMLADDIRVLDFDGDGKMELMKIDEGNTKIYTFNSLGASVSTQLLYNSGFPTKWHRIYFGDFNGDQKTDMLVRNSQDNNDGIWEKAISTGKGFVTTPFNFYVTPDITGVYSDDKLEIGDFNGDGKTDILHGWNGTSTSTLGMYYSRGDTYTYETENFGGLLGFVPLVQYDLNGDGRTDIINRTHFISPSTILYFQKEGQELLLQNIVDGHNKKTNFFYRRMTQTNNFYSRDLSTDYPLNRVTAPIYLAHRLQQDNGRSGYFTTQYKYRNAFVLRTGKGFLGFQQFDAIDLTNDVRTSLTKKFPGIFLYTLVPDRLEKYVHSTNYKYNSVEYTQGFTSRPNKSFWLRTIAIREYLLLQSQVKLNSFTYDSHGNVTKEVELNGVETITTNSSYAEYAGTVPNRITEMTVLRERTGEPSHSFSDRYYYNSKGQLTSKIDYFGLPKQVVTDYEYNDLGNEISKTISAAGMLSRQTIKDYDSKGRFVTSLTNPMGYAESATYDIKWSTKLSVTGIDGLTSTFNYDAFGRRIKTTLPTGVVINETYPFFVSALYGSTYYHRISQTGKPDQWFYFDKLGRKVHYQRRSFDNAIINETWTYDLRGLLKTVRAPYKSGETTFTTTYHYDNYNRRTSAVNPYGTTTFSYSHSGGKSKITKTNPAGQVSTVEMDASGAKTEAT
ncbi:MAG: VCBS repeat-containing protein, partial [Bacteroidota bacterium]